ncbi:GAF domain-containing protein [Tsukamurella sp. PLM1]|uniref:GAF domain-containing protein n=1 Tax=Tsukamurella sp. PLM1 TaxID=2929795 RepID=UPI0020C0E62C|nr:GAF domain-containing protein [Tsukamurella sp. PLM1]
MSFTLPDLSADPAERYAELAEYARALVAGEPDRVANAANLSALVMATVPGLNWVGFYFFDGEDLVVGPFQGLPACIRIPLSRGICGAAARSRETQRVDDVHAVPDHIACDGATRSELVVPRIGPDGALVGVFDVDSDHPARFTPDDQRGLEAIAAVFVDTLA